MFINYYLMATPSSWKIDFTEKYEDLFSTEAGKVHFVTVPKLQYLSISGEWHQDVSDTFETAMQTIYGIAFSLKLYLKRNNVEWFIDYNMPPLQAILSDTHKDKEQRKWKMLLLQPNTVTEKMVKRSFGVAKMKNQDQVLPAVTLTSRTEWSACQTLHVWPYDQEQDTIALLQETCKEEWYSITWEHHEIYLNDTRRTPKHKLHTIIRYQVKKN